MKKSEMTQLHKQRCLDQHEEWIIKARDRAVDLFEPGSPGAQEVTEALDVTEALMGLVKDLADALTRVLRVLEADDE